MCSEKPPAPDDLCMGRLYGRSKDLTSQISMQDQRALYRITSWLQSSSVVHCRHRYAIGLCHKASPATKKTQKKKFQCRKYEEAEQKRGKLLVCACVRDKRESPMSKKPQTRTCFLYSNSLLWSKAAPVFSS